MCGSRPTISPQVEVKYSNVEDCFAQYLTQMNAAETPLQVVELIHGNDSAAFWKFVIAKCLDRLLPASYKHLIHMNQFTVAYFLATEALVIHKTMFSQRTYALAKAVLREFRALCEEP